jgi:serine/threonine protein kinase
MSDERIGSEIAGYRIVSERGHGGMGTVDVAEQSSPRRRVVLKLLRPELSLDDAFRRRFNPRVPRPPPRPSIRTSFRSTIGRGRRRTLHRDAIRRGQDLRHRLATEGRVPADLAVDIVSQVASALDAAYRRGLVHRDVSPATSCSTPTLRMSALTWYALKSL